MAENVNVNVDVQELYSNLRNRIKAIHGEKELEIIDKAFNLANEYHGDQKRRSGEPYIIHPIAVCDILVDLGMDYQSLVAALLHDVGKAKTKKEFGNFSGANENALIISPNLLFSEYISQLLPELDEENIATVSLDRILKELTCVTNVE